MAHYEKEMNKLIKGIPGLQGCEVNFPGCQFMASTVNLGPHTVTDFHRDSQNLAYGLCCVIPFGNFLYRKGSLLILKELGLELEVAPGDVVFLPSACITHGNMLLFYGEMEKCYSLTLYTSDSCFSGLLTGVKPRRQRSRWKKRLTARHNGYVKGWSYHSNIDDILQEYMC